MADPLQSFPPPAVRNGTTIRADRVVATRQAAALRAAARRRRHAGRRAPGRGRDDVEPLQCWWRTSVSAIRVGEPFTLVLTCAALQTDALTAVVDRARLDPRAIELPPFEVMGGVPAPDLPSGDRVFFQYQYTLRFINEAFFNEDVPLPALSVAYRIQSRVAGQDASTQGMERRFALPHQMVRIASLVPERRRRHPRCDGHDLRRRRPLVGAGADARHHRHDRDRTRRAPRTGRRRTPGRSAPGRPVAATGLVSDAAVLRGVSRELSRRPARSRRYAAGRSISSRAPSPPRASSPSTRCPDRPASSTPRPASTRRPARWCCRAASGRRPPSSSRAR